MREALKGNRFEKPRWQQRGEFARQRIGVRRDRLRDELTQLAEIRKRPRRLGARSGHGTDPLLDLLPELQNDADLINQFLREPGQPAVRPGHC